MSEADVAIRVHVNQVAFELGGLKQAVIVTTRSSPSLRVDLVSVDDGNRVGLRLEETANFIEWGDGNRYYRTDFSSCKNEGTFHLEASLAGSSPVISAMFCIGPDALFQTTAPGLLAYFLAMRNTDEADRAVTVIDTGKTVDAWGGWNDAGGDSGKYLSHLGYSNFLTPQQASLVTWSLLASNEVASSRISDLGLRQKILDEAFWGADFLHRLLSEEGYFYTTIFDRWGSDNHRYITGYKGINGDYTPNYQAAFRKGGGLAIAALARAARLAERTGCSGEYSADQYLADAVRAFDHLLLHNESYCEDGKENIIDDYTALLSAVELFRATGAQKYLDLARERASSLCYRLSPSGFWWADNGKRPYYHAVEAGFPVISLAHYVDIEPQGELKQIAVSAMEASLRHQLQLDAEVANPFNYPRQEFRTFDYQRSAHSSDLLNGFFMPHDNETGYWWQGENARLASLSAAADLAEPLILEFGSSDCLTTAEQLRAFSQGNLDWILGNNPYGMCMLYGYGRTNPPFSESGGAMISGGISNGITGSSESPEGRGIDFAVGDEHNNWRWVEQWTPHVAWFLYALSLHSCHK